MPVPATNGQFRTKLSDMQIGDYIAVKYEAASGVVGTFSDFGASLETAQANEIPLEGTATPNGYTYLLKVDNGKLISDRVIQLNIPYTTLNSLGLIDGSFSGSRRPTAANNAMWSIVSSNSVYGGQEGYFVFDGIDETYYYVAGGGTVPEGGIYLEFNYPIKTIDTMYFKTRPISGSYNGVKTYRLVGSNNGGNTWDEIVTGVAENVAYTEQKANFPVCTYDKLRFYFVDGSYYSASSVLLCELYFTGPEPYGIPCMIRSLNGGSSYLDSDGNSSITDENLGMWPSINEWDTYIANSTLGGKITAGDDNVWHWSPNYSICRDTIGKITPGTYYKVARGKTSAIGLLSFTMATAYSSIGFRPCFDYIDVNAKAKTFWY